MSGRIPTVKVLESHELRIRKLEGGDQTQNKTQSESQSKTNELEPVKREVDGMKRDMHQITKDIQSTRAYESKIESNEKRISELEKTVEALETSIAKLRDFAMTSNQDLLRFREQIFENKKVTLQIQEEEEPKTQKSE
jgi:exonuclease VII large subunit